MRERALQLLRTALNDPHAEFRDGQWECIERLLRGERLLVVQRTGWGKSMVYFLTTLLLQKEKGFTLIVSPLLSLMRNQIEAARRIGLRAETINRGNEADWGRIESEVREGHVDVLLVSPERLGNDRFRDEVLVPARENVKLLVIDEAHCISDWGHEFRPDYRRIKRVLQLLDGAVRVLATTATANQRVIDDVVEQLGEGIALFRGPLARQSLRLQNIELPKPAARLAWLAKTIPSLPGSGIVYVLTKPDAERVSAWLVHKDICADFYHADMLDDEDDDTARRVDLEERLSQNRLKVLVAAVALGMGFDKPDLGFVIHYQRPASVLYYYQQVGRAGRALDTAYAVLLGGPEDAEIAEYFLRTAFPPQHDVDAILAALRASDGGLSVHELMTRADIGERRIEQTLRYLSVEAPAPVFKIKTKWHAVPEGADYRVDQEHVRAILDRRRTEQTEMRHYAGHRGCLMRFLTAALDDPWAADCTVCASCQARPLLPADVDTELASEADQFLRVSSRAILPRRKWPDWCVLEAYGFKGAIPPALRAEEGRALCIWRDGAWGQMVAEGKYESNHFSSDLVLACQRMIAAWRPKPAPAWVTCIPSLTRPELVPEFAGRLAAALGVPFVECVEKAKVNRQQKEMQNSFHKAANLDGVFAVREEILLPGPCLLVDDVVQSRWTLTVAAALLRRAGCEAVYPLALAQGSLGGS